MKAVVVEMKGHHVAALTDEGCVTKVKNKSYVIGEVIEIKEHAAKKPVKIVAWAISAAAAVVLVSATAWAYFTPYTYVSLDVNPSIEYSVNRFNRVLSATAVNGDGTEILKDLNLNNKTIKEAVKNTVDQIKKNGYFEGTDPGSIEISTSSNNQQNAENLAKDLQTTAQQAIGNNPTAVVVEAISVGHQRVLDAKALGTTPGKLNLVQKLQASAEDPNSIDVKEWLNKPVKTIMKAIKEHKKTAKATQKQSNSSSSSQGNETNSQTEDSSSSAVQQEPKVTGKANAAHNEKSSGSANKNQESKITSKPDTADSGSTQSKITEQASSKLSSENTQSKTEENKNAKSNENENNQNQGNAKNSKNGKSK